MTSTFAGRFVFLAVGSLCVAFSLQLQAKPMDAQAAQKLPEVRAILDRVTETGSLSDTDRRVLHASLDSGDPVLVSLAAYVVGKSKGGESTLCAKAEDVLTRAQGMPEAFIRVTLAKKKTDGKKTSERVAVIEPLLKDVNPYLQVEAAKELAQNDARKGEDALRVLLSVDSPIAKGGAFRQLHKIGKAANAAPVPIPDERYELLLSVIENGERGVR